jgi:hypothetical protein
MREEIVCPSWSIYALAAAHINAQALSEAEHRKQEANIPSVFSLGPRTFVSCGAWWAAAPEGVKRDLSDPPREISIYEVREARPEEQDNRAKRDADSFYVGRVFKSDMRRWLMLVPFTLLPPTSQRPELLQQETLF